MSVFKIIICNLRAESMKYPYDIRVDRQSVLGNPYYMANEKERDKVCDQYQTYFDNRIKHEGPFIDELRRLWKIGTKYGQLRLFCWCYPKRCHAETIKKFMESFMK